MQYTPFTDKKGNKIPLGKLRFTDICKIEENGIEEGYKVEFKSQWDENFKKKHLCQTITSFANAEGGWLLVGIEDGTGRYIGIEKQRADFSQIIAQKLAVVSPMPKFDCRFIHETNNKKKGVLVIQVYEGINPPYICNGTIYTRSGSSKVPVMSDRGSIDELLNKRTQFESAFNKFCENNFVSEKDRFPYCAIYLFNPYNKIDYTYYDQKLENIKQVFSVETVNGRILESIDSVIKLGTEEINATCNTSIEEYFINDNIKIYVPLFKLNNEGKISSWISTVAEYNSKVNMENMVIVDGIITYTTLFNSLQTAFKYIKKAGNNICDYKIVFEYRNVKNVVFYHRHCFEHHEQVENFKNDVKEGKIYFCTLSEVITEPLAFRKEGTEEEAHIYADNLLEMRYLKLFGLDRQNFINIIQNCKGEYNETVFRSETY